jgi:UDP-4-amino-4,6-dideoxy-N-acetyl-beta-L-altrosamine transaminase
MDFIPYGRHHIDDADIASVVEALRSGCITQGPKVSEFEEAVAARCGARYAVACSSGTAALHLAMLAAGIDAGDEIIGPAISFLATTNCGLFVGARPRFCDVDFASVRLTAELVEPCLSEKTRGLLPVHFAGLPCEMAEIAALVGQRCPQAVIIEDASHALGATHLDGKPVGSLTWSAMVVFSFHPVKHIATGEGGMVLTDRADLAEKLRLFRNHGMTREAHLLEHPEEGPWYYEVHELGHNFRISDINCALGCSQLRKLDRFIARRREIADRYRRELADLPHTSLPPVGEPDRSAWHLFVLHIDFASLGKPRSRVVAELSTRGIGTQVHYFPVPLQPLYRKRYGYRRGDFPAAERHYAEALTIPLYPTLTDDQVGRIIAGLKEVVRSPTPVAAARKRA